MIYKLKILRMYHQTKWWRHKNKKLIINITNFVEQNINFQYFILKLNAREICHSFCQNDDHLYDTWMYVVVWELVINSQWQLTSDMYLLASSHRSMAFLLLLLSPFFLNICLVHWENYPSSIMSYLLSAIGSYK